MNLSFAWGGGGKLGAGGCMYNFATMFEVR